MNSIFKTGTFGFSTMFSTPCDYVAEGIFPLIFLLHNITTDALDYIKRDPHQNSKQSMAKDLLLELSSSCSSTDKSSKNSNNKNFGASTSSYA